MANLLQLGARLCDAIDRRLEPCRIRFVAASLLVVALALAVVSFTSAERGRTVFGPPLGADFAGFYTAGVILNRYPAGRLYDWDLHDALYHELLPSVDVVEKLPFVHPPFVALPFQLLARLPYEWAFGLWLFLSAGLYVAGMIVLARSLALPSSCDWSLILLLALSFEPFVMECWLGGQLSTVGFFLLAVAVACEQRGRHFLAGLVLGLCLYKPTLLVLIVPLLVIGRRWKILVGFAATAAVLSVVSWLGVGTEGCREFLNRLVGFAGTTGGSGLQLRTWKYVDVNSFVRLLLGGSAWVNRIIAATLSAVPVAWLIRSWWRWDRLDAPQRNLLWAATVTGTVVFNVYVGVYDSILSVLGALLTISFLARYAVCKEPILPPTFRFLLLLLYVTPWLSQPVARLTRVQLYTLVLAAVALYPSILSRHNQRAKVNGPPRPNPETPQVA